MSNESQKQRPGFEEQQAAEFEQAGDADVRSASPPKVLRGRPVKGDVDHEALSREFIRRFPKLRAALAK